jgi:hypothetical protein
MNNFWYHLRTSYLFLSFCRVTKNMSFYRDPTMVVRFGVAKLFGQG